MTRRSEEFIRYIAESQRMKFQEVVAQCKVLAVIADGATDSAHREPEILCSCKDVVTIYLIGVKNVDKADATNFKKLLQVP